MKRNLKTKTMAVILVATTIFTQSYKITFSNHTANSESKYKIDAELLNKIKSMDDDIKLPVWIWFDDVDKETVSDKIGEKGYDSDVYENETVFEEVVVPKIEEQVVEEFGEELAHATGEAIKEYTDVENIEEENLSLVDLAVSEEVEEYNECKKEVVKEVCADETDEFVDTFVEEENIIYNNDYSKTLVVEATKEEILDYAKQDDVKEISLYEEAKVEPYGEIVFSQIGLTGTGGTKTIAYNGGEGYYGTNVKIGVLECKGRYDSNNCMLKSIHNKSLFFVDNIRSDGTKVPYQVSQHANNVLQLLVGQGGEFGGDQYEGVVPNATVYQMPIETMKDMLNGFKQLADLDVSIINMSFGLINNIDSFYDCYEKELDKLISNTGITTTISAGNSGDEVTSPGRCMNAITVGNVETCSSYDTIITDTKFKVHSTSSHASSDFLPEKPDLVAPGTNIFFLKENDLGFHGIGTSYSAPIVAGVIAQMMEARSAMRILPTMAKSYVLLGAEWEKISTENDNDANAIYNNFIFKKSGAGLVNAKRSIDALFQNKSLRLDLTNDMSSYEKDGAKKYYKQGQKIRLVMAFSNVYDDIDSLTDLDVFLYDENGSRRAKSNSYYNNVEIIEYIVPKTGYYYVKVKGNNVKKGTQVYVSWMVN